MKASASDLNTHGLCVWICRPALSSHALSCLRWSSWSDLPGSCLHSWLLCRQRRPGTSQPHSDPPSCAPSPMSRIRSCLIRWPVGVATDSTSPCLSDAKTLVCAEPVNAPSVLPAPLLNFAHSDMPLFDFICTLELMRAHMHVIYFYLSLIFVFKCL